MAETPKPVEPLQVNAKPIKADALVTKFELKANQEAPFPLASKSKQGLSYVLHRVIAPKEQMTKGYRVFRPSTYSVSCCMSSLRETHFFELFTVVLELTGLTLIAV